MAVSAGMPKQAPASSGTPSSRGTAWRCGSTTHCAAVPQGRPQAAFQTQTRSPMRVGLTPAPTASTTPMPSLCGTMRGKGSSLLRRPARLFTSDGLTPD
jgi:hypothetical protein